eukprot:1570392-Prymnesium_polylepis.1
MVVAAISQRPLERRCVVRASEELFGKLCLRKDGAMRDDQPERLAQGHRPNLRRLRHVAHAHPSRYCRVLFWQRSTGVGEDVNDWSERCLLDLAYEAVKEAGVAVAQHPSDVVGHGREGEEEVGVARDRLAVGVHFIVPPTPAQTIDVRALSWCRSPRERIFRGHLRRGSGAAGIHHEYFWLPLEGFARAGR